MNKNISKWKLTGLVTSMLVAVTLTMLSVNSRADLGVIGMGPQNCSPIHPRWVDSVYAHPNGMFNLGDEPIWVTCSLQRTFENNNYNVLVTIANTSGVNQEVTCGLREYIGPTIAASPITLVIPAGGADLFEWVDYSADDSGVSMFSVACKLPPWNGGGVILKAIWVTPDFVL